jgi:hypothetical protein
MPSEPCANNPSCFTAFNRASARHVFNTKGTGYLGDRLIPFMTIDLLRKPGSSSDLIRFQTRISTA